MKKFKLIYEDFQANELEIKNYEFETSLEAQIYANELFANSCINDLAIIRVIEY